MGYGAVRAALSRMVSRQTGFYWGTTGHTTEPVAVGALGPGAQLFSGYQDNTEFARHLHALIGGEVAAIGVAVAAGPGRPLDLKALAYCACRRLPGIAGPPAAQASATLPSAPD